MIQGSKKPLIYLHLPKTGGTTFRTIIERQYGLEAFLPLYSDGELRDIGNKTWAPPPAVETQFTVYAGHFMFGIHELIPTPCTYITLLRNPVDRIISLYYYIKAMPEQNLHEQIVGDNISLVEFVQRGMYPLMERVYAAYLTGRLDHEYGVYCDEAVREARTNLNRHFSAVGTLEKFDEFLLLMRRHFGWRSPYYVKENKTEKRPDKKIHSAEEIAAIREVSRMDCELYDRSAREFDMTIAAQDQDFFDDLEAFRLLNQCCPTYLPEMYDAAKFADAEKHLIGSTLAKMEVAGRVHDRDIIIKFARKIYPDWKALQRFAWVVTNKLPAQHTKNQAARLVQKSA